MFNRKLKLRNEYDQKLIDLMAIARKNWLQQKSLVEMSFEYNEELQFQKKLAEMKYFFLFREAKARNIRIKK
ncbi:YaaL family protein [Heyndrickxia vini]|uniref:YaaL family protein n=1 Tax=Heyndrickxia vini TaxID=1476025 RepID=A0ABX7E1K6_9BACI|nr:YaaL family protein [Heyndrickxia vini]QQZ09471.1 YaaL family protein [Heyndrickxia vini]